MMNIVNICNEIDEEKKEGKKEYKCREGEITAL